MYKKASFIIASLFFLIGTQLNVHAEASDDKINLKWNFKKGQTFGLKGVVHVDASAEVPKQMLIPPESQTVAAAPAEGKPPVVQGTEKATGSFDFNLNWAVTVKDVDAGGNATLEMAIKNAMFQANGKLGEQQMAYEVDLMKPVANPQAGAVEPQSLITKENAVSTWKVAPNGQVLSINGQDVEQSIADLEKALTDAGVTINSDELHQLTNMFFYFVVAYPSKPVSIGEGWDKQINLSNLLQSGSHHQDVTVNNFALELKQNWKVKSKQGDQITLENMSSAMPVFKMAIDGPQATINLSFTGTEKTQVLVEQLKGLAKSSNQQVTIDGKLDADEKGEKGQSFHIPFQLNINSNFQLAE